MQKQQNNPTLPAFKLSGNNSLLTLADGSSFDISIEAAFINFLTELPVGFELPETKDEVLGILDDFTKHLPENYSMARYKNIYTLMNALASFHFALLAKRNGGNHE